MITVDADAAKAVTQAIGQIGVSLDTDRHINTLLDAGFSIMKEDFDVFMTGMSQTQPSRFHHVYEWNQIGNPAMALWETYQRGQGRNREISFQWLPSVTEVPLPDVPEGPNGEQFEGGHIFHWKAPVMEYGQAVTIARRNSNALAFPNPMGDPEQPIIFTKGPVIIRNPGGDAVTGSFTATFSEWWGGPTAEQSIYDSLIRGTEKQFYTSWQKATGRLMRFSKRSSLKAASFKVNPLAAAEGQSVARQIVEDLMQHYDRLEGRGFRG